MLKFFGLIASIYAGWRVGRAWKKAAGFAIGGFGAIFVLATDIGPIAAIIGTVWLHKFLGSEEGWKEMNLIEAQGDSLETPSYQTPSTEGDEMDDWSQEMTSGTDDWSGDDDSSTRGDNTSGTDGGNWETPDDASDNSTGGTDGSSDDDFDGRDPYDIEW